MRKDLVDMTIAELVDHRQHVDAYIVRAVAQARAGGSTWAAIASSLGVSAGEAHRRYRWFTMPRPTLPELPPESPQGP